MIECIISKPVGEEERDKEKLINTIKGKKEEKRCKSTPKIENAK